MNEAGGILLNFKNNDKIFAIQIRPTNVKLRRKRVNIRFLFSLAK